MALFQKKLTEYFPVENCPWSTGYTGKSPGSIFLSEVVEVCDSINHCSRRFTRKKDGNFTKDSEHSYQILMMSSFALIMSHYETFQKSQFAEVLNTQDFMVGTDDLLLSKKLEKMGCNISLHRLLAGRAEPREPGQIIADSLVSWHNPARVNDYFRLLVPKYNFYSNEVISELEVLWQLRHSIVHTGGKITREDSHKVAGLRGYHEKKLVLREQFLLSVARRFHVILQRILDPLQADLRRRLDDKIEEPDSLIDEIAGYSSPRSSWFR
ncbi:hypothetical protein [Salinisphaera sp.]|uniref:hypothetical protein n=1 Tax=Salinisphaera sp. TaxID=1914330 RepID=UPI0025F140EB|nr:hypothetical protein [Salinisphaera sp.]|tara:strand:- start:3382 stop:4185 length:804 start_codon:yes stop_codon:yes gene_type:complete